MKGRDRLRRSNKGEALADPGIFHDPATANEIDNYQPEARFVTSEDAVKFKAWMRTDQGEFELSRPYYKTYYDYNFEFMQDRHFYLMFLLGFGGVLLFFRKWEMENARWHKHVRRTQIKDLPAHHFTNRGGVLL